MRQGDAADGLYLVGSGRLQVVIDRRGRRNEVINEVGRGELVGEMALLTDSPRSATIVALRDSHVLFLSSDAFARVVQAYPDALRSDLQRADLQADEHDSIRIDDDPGDEHRHRSARRQPAGSRTRRSIGAIPRAAGGPVPVVRADDRPAELSDASPLRRAAWREHLEAANGAVIYVADPTFDPLDRRVRRDSPISSCWQRLPTARPGCARSRRS